jgi:hypothetical protein
MRVLAVSVVGAGHLTTAQTRSIVGSPLRSLIRVDPLMVAPGLRRYNKHPRVRNKIKRFVLDVVIGHNETFLLS